MKVNFVSLFIAHTFLFGCYSSSPKYFSYPDEKTMEIEYLCKLPYSNPSSPHQAWKKSKPLWIFLDEKEVIVYFRNDRTFVIPRNSEIRLASGKYRCTI